MMTIDKTVKILGGISATLLLLAATLKEDTKSPKTLDIILLGDTSHGENYQAGYEKSGNGNIIKDKGYDYSFEKLAPLLKSADYVVANVETPLTNLKQPPFPEKGYNHWSLPGPAIQSYLRHNFSAVSLANNHTLDFGIPGLKETTEALDKAGIAWFGAGYDLEEANKPLAQSFDIGTCKFEIAIYGRFEFRDSYEEKYSFYARENRAGAAALYVNQLATDIRQAKLENPNQYIIVFPHWGSNYKWKNEHQTEHAGIIASAGANMIIGHGAHTLGEITKLGNATIVYSIGNFIFNSGGRFKSYPDVLPMSFIANLHLTARDENSLAGSLKLYPIYSDNKKTNFQPRFVSDSEIKKVSRAMNARIEGGSVPSAHKDSFGPYLEVPLGSIKCQS